MDIEKMRGPRVGGDPTFKLFTNNRLDKLRNLLDTGNLSKKDRGSVEKEIITIIRDQDMESLGFKEGGSVKKNLKPVPKNNKGLKKLPTQVRNKMGFMKKGGEVKGGTSSQMSGQHFKGIF
tara:strand:- start:301 stop:663 length:363 start_codon:yes stop_codon:yes gene_type:complete